MSALLMSRVTSHHVREKFRRVPRFFPKATPADVEATWKLFPSSRPLILPQTYFFCLFFLRFFTTDYYYTPFINFVNPSSLMTGMPYFMASSRLPPPPIPARRYDVALETLAVTFPP